MGARFTMVPAAILLFFLVLGVTSMNIGKQGQRVGANTVVSSVGIPLQSNQPLGYARPPVQFLDKNQVIALSNPNNHVNNNNDRRRVIHTVRPVAGNDRTILRAIPYGPGGAGPNPVRSKAITRGGNSLPPNQYGVINPPHGSNYLSFQNQKLANNNKNNIQLQRYPGRPLTTQTLIANSNAPQGRPTYLNNQSPAILPPVNAHLDKASRPKINQQKAILLNTPNSGVNIGISNSRKNKVNQPVFPKSSVNNIFLNPLNQIYGGSKTNGKAGDRVSILAKGFSVPITYTLRPTAPDFTQTGSSYSVTNPVLDKREIIGSYVPRNDFVNPNFFDIPAEDKHAIVDRIFGGYQNPLLVSNRQQPQFSEKNPPLGNFKRNRNTRNEFQSNNRANIDNNLNHRSIPPVNSIDYFADDDFFAFSKSSPGDSIGAFDGNVNNKYKSGNILTSQPVTVPLFPGFSQNKRLTVDSFRNKNLLGDDNFGKTIYDQTRPTASNLLGNTVPKGNDIFRNNYGQNKISKNANIGKRNRIDLNGLGLGNFKQVGGRAVTTGDSYDNSFSQNQVKNKQFDDGAISVNKIKPQSLQNGRGGFTKVYQANDGYKRDGSYSDGQDYSKQYSYNDGDSYNDENSSNKLNENSFRKKFENEQSASDQDSYSNSDGHNNAYVNGECNLFCYNLFSDISDLLNAGWLRRTQN